MRWTLLIVGIGLCAAQEWRHWGGDAGGQKYSKLKQVDRGNVAKLAVAWTYKTGEIADGKNYVTRSAFETTPLMADGVLYLTTPFNRVVALALEPETVANLVSALFDSWMSRELKFTGFHHPSPICVSCRK